jgi:hypothetical protein
MLFPTFSVCFLQLVMHRSVLFRLVQTNEAAALQFAVKFVLICIRLATDAPEVFYRGVTRIFMTIAATLPSFFVAYHCLLLESLPLRFVQFRNIILGAEMPRNDDSPPIGFNISDMLQISAIRSVIDPFGQTADRSQAPSLETPARFIALALKRAINANLAIPRVVWQFVIYCFVKVMDGLTLKWADLPGLPMVDLIVKVCQNLDDSVTVVLEAIVDNIRYQNFHTRFAASLVTILFEKGADPLKEMVLVVLLRRLLCVTAPPPAVRALFRQIVVQYARDVQKVLARNEELKLFRAAEATVESLGTKRSTSSHHAATFDDS